MHETREAQVIVNCTYPRCDNAARYLDEGGRHCCGICPLDTGLYSIRLRDIPALWFWMGVAVSHCSGAAHDEALDLVKDGDVGCALSWVRSYLERDSASASVLEREVMTQLRTIVGRVPTAPPPVAVDETPPARLPDDALISMEDIARMCAYLKTWEDKHRAPPVDELPPERETALALELRLLRQRVYAVLAESKVFDDRNRELQERIETLETCGVCGFRTAEWHTCAKHHKE